MTRDDYHLVMQPVRIAELKARLSEYLRRVRRGHPITILDRDTPIARIVPYDGEAGPLVIRQPAPRSPKVHEIAIPEPLATRADIVELLLQERQLGR